MILAELRDLLSDPMTHDRFLEVSSDLQKLSREVVFRELFAIALDTRPDNSDAWASALLVELEPPCPHSCEDVLRMIAHSRLNLSNRLIPLYLVTQFGKPMLRETSSELAKREFADDVPPELSGISYWLQGSAITLLGWYGKWKFSR